MKWLQGDGHSWIQLPDALGFIGNLESTVPDFKIVLHLCGVEQTSDIADMRPCFCFRVLFQGSFRSSGQRNASDAWGSIFFGGSHPLYKSQYPDILAVETVGFQIDRSGGEANSKRKLVNGEIVERSNPSTTSTAYYASPRLFAGGSVDTNGWKNVSEDGIRDIYGRVAGVEMYDADGRLALDCIAVRVGQTGYMYDRVSEEFFGNSSDTGELVVGPDIDGP